MKTIRPSGLPTPVNHRNNGGGPQPSPSGLPNNQEVINKREGRDEGMSNVTQHAGTPKSAAAARRIPAASGTAVSRLRTPVAASGIRTKTSATTSKHVEHDSKVEIVEMRQTSRGLSVAERTKEKQAGKLPGKSKLQAPSSPSKLSRLLPGKRTASAAKKSTQEEPVPSPSNKSNTPETSQPVKTIGQSVISNKSGVSQQDNTSTDTSIEVMSQTKDSNRPVKSVTEAKANGYTVGVINRGSPANNISTNAKFGPSGNYANVYTKETDIVQEERTVERKNISNMNFQIYQNINSYRKERTVAPVDNYNGAGHEARTRSDSSGNGDYVVYNVRNGAIHHGQGSIPSGLGLTYQNGANPQRKHSRSRTADMIDARSSTESLDRGANQEENGKSGKHVRSKSADPYEKYAKKSNKKSEKESQETKDKTKPTSRLLFMKNKLKPSKKKESAEKKEEKEKGSKLKFKKSQGEKYITKSEGKCDRGQELLDMQLPRRDYEERDLVEPRGGSRNSSVGRDDDVFSQNCDVHLDGHQVPRPLHQSVVTAGYSVSYDQITQPGAPGKPPRSTLVTRSHDQLPQKQYIHAPNLSLFNMTHEPPTPAAHNPPKQTAQEGYARKTRQVRPRSARSQTITLDSRDIPYHKCFNESAHELALSGCTTVVTKEPTYANIHGYGYNTNRVNGNGYHSDNISDDNSSIHSNPNYSDVYANTSDSSGKNSYYSSKYIEPHTKYSQNSNDQRRYADNTNGGRSQLPSYGNYADVYHSDHADPTANKRYQGKPNQLEQIPELNENTGTLRRAVTTGRVSNQAPQNGRGGLRVTDPGDLQRHGQGRKPEAITKAPTPRRHTVTVGGMDLELGQRGNSKLEQQRDVFLDHLAHRYPEHADVIKAKQGPLYGKITRSGRKGSTSSEQNPSVAYASDSDEMMEDDDGGFLRRGGRLRSSMPVVRSPNKSTEKPLGLVFLIFRNETKRALLPNEVTSVDTIRALFVRAFPDALSMQYLESKKRKIYIMDQATNVYYELEDMKDVKDRTVLKVYETDIQGVPPSPSRSPKVRGSRSSAMYNSGHESDSSTRSAPVGVPRSPMRHHRQYNDMPSKVQSLPVQPNYVYHHQMQQYASQYASMGHQGMGSPTHLRGSANQSNNNSPSRVPPIHNNIPPNQRHSLGFIPDTNAPGAPYPPVGLGIPQSRSYNDYYDVDPSRSGSATPTGSDYESRDRIDKMEAQLANLAALVQTQGIRPGVSISNSSLVSDSAKSRSESDSQQATPVQTPTAAPVPGMSDLSSATPTPGPEISVEFQNKLKTLHCKAREMKLEVRNLRRIQIDNMNTMKDTINLTFHQIKELLTHTPSVNDMPVRLHRSRVNNDRQFYNDHTSRVDRDLRDLEAAVEELRTDVLNKRCRVNPSEVETMALALSNVSKTLADLKGKFPSLQENMKSVMAGEMEVVVEEERFLKEEPDRIDAALKRCKKLTGTLFTLKRLSSVQEKRPITQPMLATYQQPVQGDKRAILENIQSIVPNHDARVQGVEAAEAARERKKRLVHNGEVLKFEKSLEMAQKQLRETNNGFVNGNSNKQDVDMMNKANIPLTDTTKRLSQQDRSNGENGLDSPPKPTRQVYDYSAAGLPHAPIPAGVTQTPAPPGVSASYIPTPHIGSVMSPSKLSQPATSTPMNGQKAQAHVTFSDSVIEITDGPRGADGGEQNGKKVPPPPPPRKSSSRTTVKNLSPTHGNPKRSYSPPAYENIENLNINMSVTSDSPKEHPTYGRSVSAPNGSSPQQGAIAQLASQYQQPKKPMSKFQQELAAGIYANMNRPDLQGQRVNHSAVVNDPNNSKDESQIRDFSDNESTTSSQDSQAGLARKMLAAKLDKESPGSAKQQSPPRLDDSRDLNTSTSSTNSVKMREGKKVPPPPPVRRTSQLSSKTDPNDSMTVEEKRRSVSELQKEIMQQMERQGSSPAAPPNGTVSSVTPERNGVIPNQQTKHLANGDIIRTDASFAVNTRTTTSTVTSVTTTTQHKVTNVPLQKQSGKKNETDIY